MSDMELVFGGTFDPAHCGHLICARAAAEVVGASRVRLIPAAQSPHKVGRPLTPASDRLAMLQLAIEGDAMFVIDDLELRRPPPSYSIDTARLLRDRGIKFRWLIGTDQLRSLHRWHGYPQLLDEIDFVVMRRNGERVDETLVEPTANSLVDSMIEVPAIAISSTQVREHSALGRSIRDLVPASVERYIEDHSLYQSAASRDRF